MATNARIRRVATASIALLLATTWAWGQPPLKPHFDFEQKTPADAWTTTACNAKLQITTVAENVRSGEGALKLSWDATDGRLAILTVSPVSIETRPRSLRLSVKLAEQSPVMYGVRERDGSSYQGYLYTPGGCWHDLAVDLDELMLSEGSHDENDRLDVREIHGVMVADLSNLPGEAGKSLGIKTGRQQMWLDDVALSDELAPHRSDRGPDGEIVIDDFDREPFRCLPLGGPRLMLTDGPGDDDPSAMRVEYDREHYRWVGFVAAVGYVDLTDRERICLQLRAEQAAPLQVVLEERDGSKYLIGHRLDPARGWYTLALPFEDFRPDTQTTDENERLDLGELRVVIPVLDTRRAEIGDGESGAWVLSRVWAD